MTRWGWLVVLSLGFAACSRSQQPPVADAEPLPAAKPPPSHADDAAPAEDHEHAVASATTCAWEPSPPNRAAPLEEPSPTATCQPSPSQKRRTELHRAVVDEWMWSWPKHKKLEVEPGCDRLGPTLRSLDFELSSGHGGWLAMARLDALDDGDWQLTLIDYSHYYSANRDAHEPGDPWVEDSIGRVRLASDRLPAARVDPIIKRVREALSLQIEELTPPEDSEAYRTRGGGSSSRDFHVSVRLIDARGHGVEHYFAGYRRSDDGQATQIKLDMAATELRMLLDNATVVTLEANDRGTAEARELFAQHLWTAYERGDEYGFWYVRERMLGLAAALGDRQHMPALLERVSASGDASVDRSRVLAINAITAITGFDPRYDAENTPRDVQVVADEVAAACHPQPRK